MRNVGVYLYNTFSEWPFGGDVSWVVPDAEGVSEGEMLSIAAELAAPATAFMCEAETETPQIRFFPRRTSSTCAAMPLSVQCAHSLV